VSRVLARWRVGSETLDLLPVTSVDRALTITATLGLDLTIETATLHLANIGSCRESTTVDWSEVLQSWSNDNSGMHRCLPIKLEHYLHALVFITSSD